MEEELKGMIDSLIELSDYQDELKIANEELARLESEELQNDDIIRRQKVYIEEIKQRMQPTQKEIYSFKDKLEESVKQLEGQINELEKEIKDEKDDDVKAVLQQTLDVAKENYKIYKKRATKYNLKDILSKVSVSKKLLKTLKEEKEQSEKSAQDYEDILNHIVDLDISTNQAKLKVNEIINNRKRENQTINVDGYQMTIQQAEDELKTLKARLDTERYLDELDNPDYNQQAILDRIAKIETKLGINTTQSSQKTVSAVLNNNRNNKGNDGQELKGMDSLIELSDYQDELKIANDELGRLENAEQKNEDMIRRQKVYIEEIKQKMQLTQEKLDSFKDNLEKTVKQLEEQINELEKEIKDEKDDDVKAVLQQTLDVAKENYKIYKKIATKYNVKDILSKVSVSKELLKTLKEEKEQSEQSARDYDDILNHIFDLDTSIEQTKSKINEIINNRKREKLTINVGGHQMTIQQAEDELKNLKVRLDIEPDLDELDNPDYNQQVILDRIAEIEAKFGINTATQPESVLDKLKREQKDLIDKANKTKSALSNNNGDKIILDGKEYTREELEQELKGLISRHKKISEKINSLNKSLANKGKGGKGDDDGNKGNGGNSGNSGKENGGKGGNGDDKGNGGNGGNSGNGNNSNLPLRSGLQVYRDLLNEVGYIKGTKAIAAHDFINKFNLFGINKFAAWVIRAATGRKGEIQRIEDILDELQRNNPKDFDLLIDDFILKNKDIKNIMEHKVNEIFLEALERKCNRDFSNNEPTLMAAEDELRKLFDQTERELDSASTPEEKTRLQAQLITYSQQIDNLHTMRDNLEERGRKIQIGRDYKSYDKKDNIKGGLRANRNPDNREEINRKADIDLEKLGAEKRGDTVTQVRKQREMEKYTASQTEYIVDKKGRVKVSKGAFNAKEGDIQVITSTRNMTPEFLGTLSMLGVSSAVACINALKQQTNQAQFDKLLDDNIVKEGTDSLYGNVGAIHHANERVVSIGSKYGKDGFSAGSTFANLDKKGMEETLAAKGEVDNLQLTGTNWEKLESILRKRAQITRTAYKDACEKVAKITGNFYNRTSGTMSVGGVDHSVTSVLEQNAPQYAEATADFDTHLADFIGNVAKTASNTKTSIIEKVAPLLSGILPAVTLATNEQVKGRAKRDINIPNSHDNQVDR